MKLPAGLKQYGPFFQPPNLPLVIWAVASLVNLATPVSSVGQSASVVGTISLTVWALLELFAGSGPFRQLLGAVVLAALAVGGLRAVGWL